jgi:FixJ family two-component response regulator
MPPRRPVVHLVDDEEEVLSALGCLLRSHDLEVVPFRSGEDCLQGLDFRIHGCVIADAAMPSMAGLELQDQLGRRGSQLPIIFTSDDTDIATCAEAMKRGAVDFLTKPIDEARLVSAVASALAMDQQRRDRQAAVQSTQAMIESLTRRERDVFLLLVKGRLNKQIAADLGIAEKTVKVMRSRCLAKLQVRSVPQMVRKLVRHGLDPED